MGRIVLSRGGFWVRSAHPVAIERRKCVQPQPETAGAPRKRVRSCERGKKMENRGPTGPWRSQKTLGVGGRPQFPIGAPDDILAPGRATLAGLVN